MLVSFSKTGAYLQREVKTVSWQKWDACPQAVQLKFLLSRETLAESACRSLHSHLQLKEGVRHCFPTLLLFTGCFITVLHMSGCDCGSNAARSFTPMWGCSVVILTPSLRLLSISGILFLIPVHTVDLACVPRSPEDFPRQV